ncbi:MAG: cation:proton antiporter [Christensenellales bacterium]
MLIQILCVFAAICAAYVIGKVVARLRLPSILGWLLAGILFGPYLANVITQDTVNALWYNVFIKFFECFAGVMIGKEIIVKKLASSGKRIVGITFIQSLGTFAVVSLVFAIAFLIMDIPFYLAFVFGGIALATAPAPALSIVNEYKTKGPVTDTLLPLAAIDDVIGVVVFFTVISVIGAVKGTGASTPVRIIGMVLIPFAIGGVFGAIVSLIVRRLKKPVACFIATLSGLCVSAATGIIIDIFAFKSFSINYLLIGMTFSAIVASVAGDEKLKGIMKYYSPLLNLSFIIVIVNLGLPLDYRLIAGAGLFTAIYILSRAAGKIGGAFLGGKITHAEPAVTKYLGFTLLPHSGVSLVFTGIAVSTLNGFDPSLANIVSGTIVSAAVINEIIAVITAKIAFKKAGEIPVPASDANPEIK